MALLSTVSIFVDITKLTRAWGFKFVAMVFSFIIANSWALHFADRTLHENNENWYATKINASTVYESAAL